MYPFQTQSQKNETWVCNLMCGCAVNLLITRTFPKSENDARLYMLMHPEEIITKEDLKETITFEANTILNQCTEHSSFATAQEMFDNLRKYKATTWKPDTCTCCVTHVVDISLPPEERQNSPVLDPLKYEKCEFHSETKNYIEHLDIVKEENQRKNFAIRDLAYIFVNDSVPILVDTVDSATGEIVPIEVDKRFPPEKEVKWRFDANRNLELNITGLGKQDPNHKNTAETAMNDTYAGKVVLVDESSLDVPIGPL